MFPFRTGFYGVTSNVDPPRMPLTLYLGVSVSGLCSVGPSHPRSLSIRAIVRKQVSSNWPFFQEEALLAARFLDVRLGGCQCRMCANDSKSIASWLINGNGQFVYRQQGVD